MRKKKDPAIAEPEEVLRVMTAILRGESPEDGAVKPSERYKAAELLGKHYGLFEHQTAPAPDHEKVAQKIGRMLSQIKNAG